MNMVLGIDFDNTLVSYDNVLYQTALEWDLIPAGFKKDKKNIRDEVRRMPDGEITWQKLQAHIYGKGMKDAVLCEGVKPFFDACRSRGIKLSVISHKTEFASMDQEGVNLREAAIGWMKKNRFFAGNGLGISPENVYFESTRQGKIGRIKGLGCTHFIDDLEETFFESSFPSDVEKILYTKESQHLSDVKAFSTWEEIYDYFFAKQRA